MEVKVWCVHCGGTGNFSIPDYDWDENYIGDMELDCEACDGKGYELKTVKVVDRLEEIIRLKNNGEITKKEADKLKMELVEGTGGIERDFMLEIAGREINTKLSLLIQTNRG